MSKFGIFLFYILIFWEIVECMDNKGKGKVGEESSGQEGGASSQGRRGGSRRSHAHIPTRESEPTQNWNEEHEMGPTEGHAPNLDDEIQNQHELLMQERLMHLQQHTEMINQLQNATERLNLPQELRRNLRIKPEKLMQNMQKKNEKIAKLQTKREKSLKKKENAIYDQGREDYLDGFEFSNEMREIAKKNNKDLKAFSKEKMAEVQNYLYGHVAEDDVVHNPDPVRYRLEGGEPQPFMAGQQIQPHQLPTGFDPISQYTGHPYQQGWPLNDLVIALCLERS
ncbi:unnamed protein product [Meloidogyne enterolobii]|uniref:Uncharacterized protein n=1 Tax=Meloidogyne enterolobii TaxID=390850 RepID=A0ACB1ABV0_MELEN